MGNHEDFGAKTPGNANSSWGTGAYIQQAPEFDTARYDNFQGGYNSADNPQNTPTNASPWSENTYTDRKDRIARCPGTVGVHTFSETPPQTLGSIEVQQNLLVTACTGDYAGNIQFKATAYDEDSNLMDPQPTGYVWTCDLGTIDPDTGLWTPPNNPWNPGDMGFGAEGIVATIGDISSDPGSCCFPT